MSARLELNITIPEPSEQQLIALQGLRDLFGWQITPTADGAQSLETTEDGLSPTTNGADPAWYARMIVKDAADTVFEGDSEALDETAKFELGIRGIAEQIAEPYYPVFDPKLPSVESNTRTMFRKIREGYLGVARWSYTDITEARPLTYDYEMGYVQGAKANRIQKVGMEVHSEKEKDAGGRAKPGFNFFFDDAGELWRIDLSTTHDANAVLDRMLEGTTLAQVVKRNTLPLEDAWHDVLNFSIDISRGTLTHTQSVQNNAPDRDHHDRAFFQATSEYRISEADNGTIERFITAKDEKALKTISEFRPNEVGTSITVAEYLAIVKDLLGTIPASADDSVAS